MSHVVGEIGANAEAGFEAPFEILVQIPCAFQIQPIAECEHFGAAVNFQLLVVRVGFVAPNIRVAAVVAQSVKQLGKIKVKIAQKGIHTDYIGERDAQIATVFVHPSIQRGFLEIAQAHIQRLKGLQEFVRHRADGGDAEFFGKEHVAGAAHYIGGSLNEGLDDMALPGKVVAAACAEIRHQKRRRVGFLQGVVFFEQLDFLLQTALAFFQHGRRFQAVEIQLVHNRENVNLKKHGLDNRAFDTDVKPPLLVAPDFHEAAFELE